MNDRTPRQEVMTPEMANAVREYERTFEMWNVERRSEVRTVMLCVPIAAALYLASFFASAHQGPVNQSAWFAIFAVVAFVAATALSIASIVMAVSATKTTKPVRPALLEPIARKPAQPSGGG